MSEVVFNNILLLLIVVVYVVVRRAHGFLIALLTFLFLYSILLFYVAHHILGGK